MKTEHLHDLWAGPDNSRLTTKQFSFRLPVHIAAKIAALCDMYPQKNRTQIVADLLTSALDELEKNLPEALGEEAEDWIQRDHAESEDDLCYYLSGARGRFRKLSNKYYKEFEKELGNEHPEILYSDMIITRSQIKA